MPKPSASFIYTAVIGKHGWVGRVLDRNRKHLSFIGCGFATHGAAMQAACALAYFLSEAADNPYPGTGTVRGLLPPVRLRTQTFT